MKYIIVALVSFSPFRAFSQELKLSMENGFAIGEMKDLKKIMLHTGITAAVEFNVSKDLCLVISGGGSLLRFTYRTPANEPVFNRKYFLVLPVLLRKYYVFSRRSGGFLDAGVCLNYLTTDKKETRNGITLSTSSQNHIGYNLAGSIHMGFKTMITPVISFAAGIGGGQDLTSNYKQELNKIKVNRTSLIISFSRKI